MNPAIQVRLGHIIRQEIAIEDGVFENTLKDPVPVWMIVVETDQGALTGIVPSRAAAIVKASDMAVELGGSVVHVDDEPTGDHSAAH